MKVHTVFYFWFFVFSLFCQAGEVKTWTNSEGKQIKAEFVSISKEGIVRIEKMSEGWLKTFELPLFSFSKKDQHHILKSQKDYRAFKIKGSRVKPEKNDPSFSVESFEISVKKVIENAKYSVDVKEIRAMIDMDSDQLEGYEVSCHLLYTNPKNTWVNRLPLPNFFLFYDEVVSEDTRVAGFKIEIRVINALQNKENKLAYLFTEGIFPKEKKD